MRRTVGCGNQTFTKTRDILSHSGTLFTKAYTDAYCGHTVQTIYTHTHTPFHTDTHTHTQVVGEITVVERRQDPST